MNVSEFFLGIITCASIMVYEEEWFMPRESIIRDRYTVHDASTLVIKSRLLLTHADGFQFPMVTATDPTGSSSLSEAANNNTTPNNAPTTSDPSNDPISSLSNPVGAPAGKPYYDTLRTTLRATIASKRAIDEQLLITEENIYKLETNYLDDTSAAGNIIRGFDNWVKGVVVTSSTGGEGGGNTLGRKRAATVAQINTNSGTVKDDDRIFSGSSVAWTRVC